MQEDGMGSTCSTHVEKRNAYRILVRNLGGKRPLGRVRTGCVWLRIGSSGWLLSTWSRTLGLHKRRGISWLDKWLLASQEELCSMEFVKVAIFCFWHYVLMWYPCIIINLLRANDHQGGNINAFWTINYKIVNLYVTSILYVTTQPLNDRKLNDAWLASRFCSFNTRSTPSDAFYS